MLFLLGSNRTRPILKTLLPILATLLLLLSNLLPTVAAPRARHVFIVSFDGGKPEVMRRSAMPLTMQMAKTGAATWNAQTVFPSVTLASHTSMLTGVDIPKHGITWNDWQPARGLVKVPTVFGLAHRAGLKTAAFAGKEKFKHLNVPGVLNRFAIPDYSALVVAKLAAGYITAEKPNLCFVHFADSDGAGHKYGWGSAEQVKAFGDEDVALRMLREAVKAAGIEKSSVFILSADHGGHDRTHGSNRPEDMTIPWIAWGAGVKPGGIKAPVRTYDTAATALWLLGLPVPASFDGKPVTSAFQSVPVVTAAKPRIAR